MEDLTNEILVCLPVKSLLRFGCVSKSWYQIIHSRDFIHSHLHKSSDNRRNRTGILSWVTINTSKRIVFSAINIKDGFVEGFRPNFYQIPTNFYQIPNSFQCLYARHCNGLVLLNPWCYEFSVLNPSTRHYRKLPALPVDYQTSRFSRHFGFGHDPTNDDYKVVLLISLNRSYEVWIFGFNSNCWRKIPGLNYIEYNYRIVSFEASSFVNGYVHFLSSGDRGRSHIIMAFDVAKETFSIVPLPTYNDKGQVHEFKGLQAFEGCLSIKFCMDMKVDLYVRKKIGVDFIWNKLFSLTTQQGYALQLGRFRILGYAKEVDKILLICSGRIYSYDLKKTSIEKIETSLPISSYLYDFIDCVESLVSVGSGSLVFVAKHSSIHSLFIENE